MGTTQLEEILTPKTGDTMIRFLKIKEKYEKKFSNDDDLRLELIYAGALKFENKNAKPKDRERWGLVKNNLKLLHIKDKKLEKAILANMEKNRKLMPKYLVQLLLNDSRFCQREFSTLQGKLQGIDKKQLKRILVFAGALRFYNEKNKELWGLARRSLDILGFSEYDSPKRILRKMDSNPSRMPYHLAELLLENPLFYRRTLDAIMKKFGGFSKREVRGILYGIGAIRFEDKKGNEYWGLKRRNKELLLR